MDENKNNKVYWRSLSELSKEPAFIKAKENEFPEEATEQSDPKKLHGISRRMFLALTGASAAFAATACTNYRDKGEIIQYNKKPEDMIIGRAEYYASTCTGCELACGILIKTREGRPIKIDGNPSHPINTSKICATGQANILNLYDPERLKQPMSGSNGKFQPDEWMHIDKQIISALSSAVASNKEIVILTHSVISPTQKKLFDDFKAKYPTTKIYSYELFNESNRNNAWKACYGGSEFPIINWQEAKVILTLESDILGNEGNFVEQIRLIASKRNADDIKNFSRLYSAEGSMTLTGMNADHRIILRPDAQFDFVMSLLNEIIFIQNISSINLPSEIEDKIKQHSLKKFIDSYKLNKKVLDGLVKDLKSNKGKSIIYAGSGLPEQVHIAVNILNEILENFKLFSSEHSRNVLMPLSKKEEIAELVKNMNNGNVGVIIHFDTNPVFHFASDYNYESALKKVPYVVTFTEHENETSSLSKYVLPVHHNFESWGDYQTRTGIISLQQPVINPLYQTRQKESALLNWLSPIPESYNEDNYHQYMIKNWESNIYLNLNSAVDFKTFWFAALEEGVIKYSEPSQNIPSFNLTSINSLDNKISNGKVVLLKKNYTIGDGRFANNGWLQELPHPISKVTWDNYAALSLATAKVMGLAIGDKIEINIEGKKQVYPVMIQPGMADDLVTIELGYGRTNAGTVGTNVGFSAILLMSMNDNNDKMLTDALINKVNGKYKFASTQEFHAISEPEVMDFQQKRGIIQDGTVTEFINNPDFIKQQKRGEDLSIMNRYKYNTNKWAMAIDLNKCVGCGICVSACNVENNVPVVGKEMMLNGRGMHWIRIDRYYSNTPEEPEVSNQPMLCMQCDNAPCENVCPVEATSHSPDGLNQMVYNRCVGTRYCSNNCPYKVRRFNYFNFRNHFANGYYAQESLSLLQNPEVTVRSRGVMEKCTFCVQRIMEGRQEAIKNGVQLDGSKIKTACQEACPADAITFGDSNKKDSPIDYARNHKLGYHVLEELNIKPNVTYIAKLRNKASEDIA